MVPAKTRTLVTLRIVGSPTRARPSGRRRGSPSVQPGRRTDRTGGGPWSPDRRARFTRTIVTLAALTTIVLAVVLAAGSGSASSGRRSRRVAEAARGRSKPPVAGPNLVSGSDPSVLPGPVLVADSKNNRLIEVSPTGEVMWEFPRPGDLSPGQSFLVPDDAFFTPDGRQIVVTQEDDQVISLVDVATRHVVWTYGTPGSPGSGPNHVSNPDDAMMAPNGDVLAADIKNCRLLIFRPGQQVPLRQYGVTGSCRHGPPTHYASPNGAFPMVNGHYLVTEINGDWVDEIGLDGRSYFSAHPPGEAYPSDSNEVAPGIFLSVDYSSPGQIEYFDSTGHLLWRYKPAGADALDHPSLAVPLPNGDILANDDYNDRVIVVDPRTNRIVWQYGHTGQPGSAPGYLNVPDGVDLAPPFSLLIRHSPTMGVPPP